MFRYILVFLAFSESCVSISFYPTVPQHNKLIALSFDGFRNDYMTKTSTPTLDKLISEGVTSPYMQSQFPTKTFSNHQSLATGLFTESHGVTDNQVFDPKYNAVLSGYTSAADERFWNFRPDVVPVWILNEWAGNGRCSGVGGWPGSNTPYGENATLPSHLWVYNNSLSYEARMDLVVQWLMHEDKPANLVYMYFEEPDASMHAFGPDSSQVIQQIQRLDRTVKYLLQILTTAGIRYDVDIVITSDHGGQAISQKTEISISEMADRSLYNYKVYGDSPVLQIAPFEGQFESVYNAFRRGSEVDGKNFTLFIKKDLPYQWYYKHNRRVMLVVLVAKEGYSFVDYSNTSQIANPNDENKIQGTHGYDNREINMRAFFLAYGPSFKNGVQINAFSNVDIFPLMCKLINVPAPPNNGTLNTVRTALKGYY